MLTAKPHALHEIDNSTSDTFPVDVLYGCKNALALFSAGFYGANDVIWMARANIPTVCVDLDVEKLDAMEDVYPRSWEFVLDDVFRYVKKTKRTWDLVTADPWTQQFQLVADIVPALCKLSKRAVVVGCGSQTLIEPPAGWTLGPLVWRSDYVPGGVHWAVLERMKKK